VASSHRLRVMHIAARSMPVAVLVALSLLAAACGNDDDGGSGGSGFFGLGGSTTSTAHDADDEADDPTADPAESVDWNRSGSLEFATIEVPLDYDDPGAGTIELAVARRPARDPDQRIGPILMNPGGPGASGIELVGLIGFLLPGDLLDRFDLVSWDPRGVGQSTQVRCGDGEFMDRFTSMDPVPPTPEAEAEVEALVREFAELCEADSGWLLPHIHTEASARDMDRVRVALGDDQISYIGFSYGTFLGATYAELFPERVRALVLDGAYSRSVRAAQLSEGQAAGFERSVDSWFAWCQRTGCSFDQGGDLGASFDELMESIRLRPLPTGDSDGRSLTVGLAWTGVVVAMYTPELWTQLDRALTSARDGRDGSPLLSLADLYNERSSGPTFSTLQYAFMAYSCMDNPRPSAAEERQAAERALAAAPRVGPIFVSTPSPCEHWPVEPRGTADPFSIEGGPPILVIATTGDPATPYEWGVQLAAELDTAELLTVEGDGHTAFAGGNRCVDRLVVDYLLTVELPGGELRCAA
jgi:pimeloyl-ACP methyl ester carboxylesterase